MKTTKYILEKLKKELEDRDYEIEKYKKKCYTLELIKNDWIAKDLIDSKKEWPKDYIKQKKEWAEWKVDIEKQRAEFNEILKKQEKHYKLEITSLEIEIEMLKERLKKKGWIKRTFM